MNGDGGFQYFHTGEVQFEVSGENRLPDVECAWVKFRACPDNKDWLFLGNHRVSEPDHVTDFDCGWPLEGGGETDWIPVCNLNLMSVYAREPEDRLFYMLVK